MEDAAAITNDLIKRALGAKIITPEQAEAIRLKDVEENTFEQAGQSMDLAASTVHKHYTDGLKKLGTFIEKEKTEHQSGKVTAAAFELFNKGRDPVTVAVLLSLEAPAVKALLEQWKELKALDLTTKSVPKALAELQERVKELEGAAPFWNMVLYSFTPTHDRLWCGKCGEEMKQNEKWGTFFCEQCNFGW